MCKAGLAKMIAVPKQAGLELVGEGELTDYLFTGQHFEEALGLYWVGSRWLDPALGRWIQADSVVTDSENPIDFDRYAYVRNNPLLYVDPSGHMLDDPPSPFPGKVLWVDMVIELNNKQGPEAQYIAVPSDVYQSKYGDQKHYNLCGHLSFAAIFETENGIKGLGQIWNMYPTSPNEYSGGWAGVINSIDGWSATYKWFSGLL